MMKISCSNLMLPGNNLTEQATLLYKWGYGGIALFMNYCQWNEELHEEILNLRENTGIIPCEFAFTDEIYGHLMSDNIDLRKKSRDEKCISEWPKSVVKLARSLSWNLHTAHRILCCCFIPIRK
ncbi:hypothetical protein GPY53_16590 [Photorhabdus laumondii subsp. laumondii]|nr:hypothetical protein [Photorhabdus laumondii]MCC8384271.1 hypothetical protein [Photorhabdus laumondii]MCC8390471.1 hypothetical protein [Photorhabdus laumondii]MCC8414796.1 hypothetical protein [Photorhabdus laumondii]MCZ1251544.1 hypothetical protein [Photorhabdus laumondii subsp. laumondii]NDL16045.1 hypothetical protein [Photorhabdus laumondii subsp. laumondii]